ncbi:MAG: DctP family TRAP transporter solute-binding subunit [Firmicutes bacterium]|nr:DctP family TRAP transporter solute-binding subunit [Bacillota bacterium]
MRRGILFLTVSMLIMASVTVMGAPTPQNPAVLKISYNAPELLTTDVVQWEQEHGMGVIFKNLVESGTGGAIKVELYPSSQLGDNVTSIEMVMSGSIEGVIGTGVLPSFYPKFEVISIPYLFKSPEIAWWVFDNTEYWAELEEDLRQTTGLRLLAMGQNGVRHFTHKSKFIKTPADLKGEKMRVMQSPIFVKMMQAFGANPVPIAWTEVYTSLQTGVVDGHENPVSVIAANNIHEVQSYLTLDGHLWSEDFFVISDKLYSSLPTDMQVILKQAAKQAEVVNRGIETIHSTGPGLSKLIREGMKVYTPTMEEKAQFAEVAQPAVIEYLEEKVGKEAVQGMLDAVVEAETALGYID